MACVTPMVRSAAPLAAGGSPLPLNATPIEILGGRATRERLADGAERFAVRPQRGTDGQQRIPGGREIGADGVAALPRSRGAHPHLDSALKPPP